MVNRLADFCLLIEEPNMGTDLKNYNYIKGFY